MRYDLLDLYVARKLLSKEYVFIHYQGWGFFFEKRATNQHHLVYFSGVSKLYCVWSSSDCLPIRGNNIARTAGIFYCRLARTKSKVWIDVFSSNILASQCTTNALYSGVKKKVPSTTGPIKRGNIAVSEFRL